MMQPEMHIRTAAVRFTMRSTRRSVSCTKAEVVKTGLELNVPYELTWSCYEGGEKPCGVCGTCIDRAEAFRLNGVKDPALDR